MAGKHGAGAAIALDEGRRPRGDEASTAAGAGAVAPDWRRAGLATALVEMLARRALEGGITDLSAMFLAQNRPVTELAHGGHAKVVIAHGIADLHAVLAKPHEDVPGLSGANAHQ